ncbi:MAG: hypothetical protein WA715_07865 [Candidatus Acidiferrum sp.]|jgi:hypothetical protein
MKSLFRAGLLTLLFCGLLPNRTFACDCADPGPPCKAFANTPVVFAGRVVKIATISLKAPSGDFYEDRLIFLEVERSYRGSVGGTAEVVTGSVSTECGYDFRQGEHDLVYAYPHPQSGKLYTGICQRTRPISEAGDDLDYLSKKDDPSHGAGIEGTIEELTRDSRYETRVVGFMAGISLLVQGKSGRWTTVSEKNGRFRLWGLPPGRYRITPGLPKGFLPSTETVTLQPHSCATIRFLATPPPRTK